MIIIEDVQISLNPVSTGGLFTISLTAREVFANWEDVKTTNWGKIETETWARVRDKMFEGGL